MTQTLLMVFIDGLGIGPRDPDSNPLARFRGRVLNFFQGVEAGLPRGGRCIPTGADLGVEGLPQSATGQVSLFTGVNAAALLGRHLQGFPGHRLRGLLSENSIFRKAVDRGLSATFANAFTPRHFTNRPRRVSATTSMCESAKLRLRDLNDLREGRALFMDFTNRRLRQLGHETVLLTPREAARVLGTLSRDFDLCLYEYFLTDLVGHRGSMEEAVALLAELDEFLAELVETLDLSRSSLLICSDHGNIEDKSTRLHTRNPVPTMVWGGLGDLMERAPEHIDQIAPFVELFLHGQGREVK